MLRKKSVLFAATLLSAIALTSCGEANYVVGYNKYLSNIPATSINENDKSLTFAQVESKVVTAYVFNVQGSYETTKKDASGNDVATTVNLVPNYYYKILFDGTLHPYKGVTADTLYLRFNSLTGNVDVSPLTTDFYDKAVEVFSSGSFETFETYIKGSTF